MCPSAVVAWTVGSDGVRAGAAHGVGCALGDGAPRGPLWAVALLGLLLGWASFSTVFTLIPTK